MTRHNYLKLLFVLGLLALLCFACREEEAVRELEAKSADVNLYVRVAGYPKSGRTLIAIGGGPGLSSTYITSLERLAGPDFGVVTYDQRGVGRSSAPSSYVISYNLMDYVNDLEAVRNAVGVERVHLLGHYWGAMIALYYASLYPENVGSIVLYGGAPPTWDWMVDTSQRIVNRIVTLIEEGVIHIEDFPVGSSEWWREVIRAYFSDPNFWFSPEEDVPPDYNYNVNQLTAKAIREYDLTEKFAQVDHRVLILFGEDDPAGRPVAVATKDALSNADVELVEFKKCGHFWQECPDQFYAHVNAFLGLPSAP